MSCNYCRGGNHVNHFFRIVFLQVETVAQFGVVFLLFALGLEFSLAKVCNSWLTKTFYYFTHLWRQIDKLFFLHFHFLIWICFEIFIHLVKSCGACCCSWRAASNCNIHVPLWNSCHGMGLTVANDMVFSTIVL